MSRDRLGQFSVGNAGKPKGARHATTRAIETLLKGEAETLTRKAIALALDGDTVAMKLCLDRIAPPRKEATVSFDMPYLSSASAGADLIENILRAVADGQIAPGEAAKLGGLVECWRKARELGEIEDRLSALEARQEKQVADTH